MKIKTIIIENFKGIKNLSISFGDKTEISGQNAVGKTSIVDAFMWLLFNQDSHGNSKFDVRPLDNNGRQIDNVEISVVATLDIDGKETVLSKVQKQKWVKHRGQDQAKFEGNVNEYEVDGYPKTEKDYNSFISSLVDMGVFKMISSPTYFVNLPWKDQREVLMRFVSDMSDVDLASSNSEFADLLPEIEKAPSTDDIQKKYSKVVKELKARQTEIPVRIDEIAKQKVDVDTAELELAKADCERQLAELNNVAVDTTADAVHQELLDVECALMNRKTAIRDEWSHKYAGLDNECRDKNRQSNDLEIKIDDLTSRIERNTNAIANDESERKRLGDEYKTVRSEEFKGVLNFDEDEWVKPSTVCSLCGQELPKDKADKIISEFEERKAAAKDSAEKQLASDRNNFASRKQTRLDDLKDRGFACKDRIEKATAEITQMERNIATYKDQKSSLDKEVNELLAQIDAMGKEPDYTADDEYNTLLNKQSELKGKLQGLSSKPSNGDDSKRLEIKNHLDEINARLAQAQNNISIDGRIAELESEQRDVSQKIADAEKMLYLLERFIKAKLNRVSDAVNSHFKMVKFRLFEELINGGVKETCEMEYNGVPFSSLNSGHRLIGGLDIVNALSDLYGVSMPVWVDNAESLSEGNVPNMTQQMILLEVSNDKILIVKGE